MGYNTVAVIMNDAMGWIEEDPTIGAAIGRAVRQWHMPKDRRDLDVPARSAKGGIHCNAITIVSQDHADVSQVVVIGGNCGRRADEIDNLDHYAAVQMIRCLERNGFKVTKRRPAKYPAQPAAAPGAPS